MTPRVIVVGQDLGEVGLDAVQRQRRDVSRVGLGSIDVGRHVRVHVGNMQRGDVDAVGGELLAGGVRHRPRGGLRGAVGAGAGGCSHDSTERTLRIAPPPFDARIGAKARVTRSGP